MEEFRSIDVVMKRPSKFATRFKSQPDQFLRYQLAKNIANGSALTGSNWFGFFVNRFATNFHGNQVIAKGTPFTARHLLENAEEYNIDWNNSNHVLGLLLLLESGAVAQKEFKIERFDEIQDIFNDSLDVNNSKDFGSVLSDVKISIIREIVDSVMNDITEKQLFDFAVGPRNMKYLTNVEQTLMKITARLKEQLTYFNRGLSFIDVSMKAAAILSSPIPKVRNWVIDHDLEYISDISPLVRWFMNTDLILRLTDDIEMVKMIKNGSSVSKAKKDEAAEDKDGKKKDEGTRNTNSHLPKFKKLKYHQKHQEMICKLLDKLFLKYNRRDMRAFFDVEVISLRDHGAIEIEDPTSKNPKTQLTLKLAEKRFMYLNYEEEVSEDILALESFDKMTIDNENYHMYMATDHDLGDMISIQKRVMNNFAKTFGTIKNRAISNLSNDEDFKFEEFEDMKFSNYTIGLIFADRLLADMDKIWYEFNSRIPIYMDENSKISLQRIGTRGDEITYQTDDPSVIKRYGNIQSMINGTKKIKFLNNKRLPTVNDTYDIAHGVYSLSTAENVLNKDLKYFDYYKKLLQPPTEIIRGITDYDKLRMVKTSYNDVFKKKTVGALFDYLSLIDPFTESLSIVLSTSVMDRISEKYKYFISKLDKNDITDKSVATTVVRESVEPILQWLRQINSVRILTAMDLNQAVRHDPEFYKTNLMLCLEFIHIMEIPLIEDLCEFDVVDGNVEFSKLLPDSLMLKL